MWKEKGSYKAIHEFPRDLSENQDESVRDKRRVSFVPEKDGCADMRAQGEKSYRCVYGGTRTQEGGREVECVGFRHALWGRGVVGSRRTAEEG
jgi:hypothetical protein